MPRRAGANMTSAEDHCEARMDDTNAVTITCSALAWPRDLEALLALRVG